MNVFMVVQALVIGLTVMASAAVAFRKLLPQTSRRLFGRIAHAWNRPGRSLPLRWLGRRLQPAEASSGGCGSGDGCGSCGGCAPAPAPSTAKTDRMPLDFRPRQR
ncbi:hypothetical protein ASG87_17220 [Frateuria sp. Soil773]|uniref:DUF6587 family protein n=1 Tax=Frateuria sp. Soil773 TaxID=1736407 RepID=UPI0006FCB023|nr:DUF6587 family protein [Frateuria sp. Soil773]KRE95016.1 hypothetical protein ASG87_17220 [Frateuria sp. Soil773]